MATLDSLEIVVKGNTSDAEKKLKDLEDRIKGLSKLPGGGGETPVVKTVKGIEKSAKKANTVLGNLAKSIGRIAFYRAIRTALKEVTQGFSEGIKNAYAWAEANNDAFKSVMDSYATEGLYLKNSLGALSATLLTPLLPVIISIGDALAEVINRVSEFVAALFGQDWYYRAIKMSTIFGEQTDKAAAAQKRLNQQLMAFDELNVITTPRQGNGGAVEETEIGGFDKAPVNDFFKTISNKIDSIRKKVEAVIKPIWDGFIKGIENIDLEGIKRDFENMFENAKKIVEKFGSFDWEKISFVAGKMADLVLRLTAFAGSSAFQHIYNLVELVDSILHFNPIATILSAFRELLTIIHDLAGVAARVADVLTFNRFNFAANLDAAFSKGMSGLDSTITKLTEDFTHPKSMSIEEAKPAIKAATQSGRRASYAYEADIFASGGFPNQGSIFTAGEIPGQYELLGTINGRTGVAGGAEITGISSAVYETGGETNALLRELIAVSKRSGLGRPNAAFGKYVTESLRLYKGVTG